MTDPTANFNISQNLNLIELSSSSLRAIGKLGHFCTLAINRFVYHSPDIFNELVGIAIIIAGDRCFAKTRPELTPKWHFFLSEPGKSIYFLIFTLALLNFYSNMQSGAQTIGYISLSFTVLSFCLMQFHKSCFEITSFVKIPKATVARLRTYQLRNRYFAITCSLALLTYAIMLPFYFYDTDFRNISIVRLFILSSGVLCYWYGKTVLLQMQIIRSGFWLPLLLMVYKLKVSLWLVWQADAIEFGLFPKLKGFAILIAFLNWTLGFMEIIAFKCLQQHNSTDNLAEENDDKIEEGMSLRLANIEQLAQVLTVIFGILWFACVSNHEFGLHYGFVGLSLILIILLLNVDMKTSHFKTIQCAGLKQKNSWKSASRSFFTGHLIYFFIQGSYSDKPSFKEKEITLSFIVSTIGFLTAGFYWCAGFLRFYSYTKKNMCSADFTNEENAQLIFPDYKLRMTPMIQAISCVTKILFLTATGFAIALAFISLFLSSTVSSFSFSNHCAFSWVVMFTMLVSSQVIQKVAFPGAPYLTRTLLKGLVNLVLGLVFRLTNRFKVSESSSELNMILRLITSMNSTTVCFFLIGGIFLILLHGVKFESNQKIRQVTLPDGNMITLENSDTNRQHFTTLSTNLSERRRINRLASNQRSKRFQSGEKKGKRNQSAAVQEKLIGDHILYYKAFAALAKGE